MDPQGVEQSVIGVNYPLPPFRAGKIASSSPRQAKSVADHCAQIERRRWVLPMSSHHMFEPSMGITFASQCVGFSRRVPLEDISEIKGIPHHRPSLLRLGKG